MATDLTLPKLGVEMDRARLLEWAVAEGEPISAGQVVATVETDKVQFDLEAPGDGYLIEPAEVDREYLVGDRLAVIADSARSPDADGSAAGSRPPASQQVDATVAAEEAPVAEAVQAQPADVTSRETRRRRATEHRRGEPLASPLARRVASELGVDLGRVTPTGARGVIRRRDVEGAARSQASSPPEVQVAAAPPADPVAGGRRDRHEPLSATRRTIAQRMQQSLRDAAQMTDVREHDVTSLVALRRRAVAAASVVGFRLSYTDLFVRAAALALREVPVLNSRLEGDTLSTFGSLRLGVAVAVPDGLLVPVIEDPDLLSLATLHHRLDGLFERARTRRSTAEELSGGTFTLTNYGSFGTHFGTPILVPGQVGILGFGALVDRPVVRDGQVVPGTTMYTSLTVDHQVIDGETAGQYQTALGALLAEPDALLLR